MTKLSKITAIALVVIIMVTFMISCKQEQPNEQPPVDTFWGEFYSSKGALTQAVVLQENYDVNKASYGYANMSTQGYNGWYYGTYDGAFSECVYSNGVWSANGAVLNGKFVTSNGANGARKYVNARDAQTVTVSGTLSGEGGNGRVRLQVLHNGIQLFATDYIDCTDTVGLYYEREFLLEKGDELLFVLEGTGCAALNPMIVYNNAELLLHAQNSYGYWGDLIPFYNQDDGNMYMYYMTGDTSDLANPVITMNLAISKDMFNYVEQPMEIHDFVKRAVNLNIWQFVGLHRDDFLDFETFPEGFRDCYFFFDAQSNCYRYVALCYYTASGMIKCALGTRRSDDAEGQSWTQPIKILKNFPLFRQPECPCAMFINDRWYIFCSLWGESIHNVGRLRYYIGDQGKGIDEQDWLNKPAYYLDGEDICGAQIVDVGGRYLMYGWIVKCYPDAYFPKNIDNGLWGGDMSIQREVYQKEDGTLGVRLPDAFCDRLNRGVVLDIGNVTVSGSKEYSGNFRSSLITTSIDMKEAEECCLTLVSQGKEYDVRILRKEGLTRFIIGCAADTTHTVAASYDYQGDITNFEIVILIEGNTIELFVNDEISLAARTSMFTGEFSSLKLTCNGKADFIDTKICKLANSCNIYD